MMTANVTNIQRFSLNDGPGIRTAVFFEPSPVSVGKFTPLCREDEQQYHRNEA